MTLSSPGGSRTGASGSGSIARHAPCKENGEHDAKQFT